ncbi:DUF342 domain-containing protein [Campylobacter novaezeelandiae]|uniref:flagellar assembly protein A n=1 Tax=Campylobacter novaezeelandiae TaxID=2267891 RepID=UPI0010380D50|nr:flagellar assembly protein A [Campylobacter novaezeelandiae]TBR81659.1 DUF342 domain-containing protein [Campylobacter novaezeelandiae]
MLENEKIISYTSNPYQELLAVASRTNIDVNELDYHLLAFSTWYRFGDEEWKKISEKELNIFEQDEFFLKNNLQVKQEYKIEIIHNANNNVANAIKLIANKNLTKLIAEIELQKITYHEKIALELLQNIYKKMIKLKFLIGIRIFDFKKQLIETASKIKSSSSNFTQVTIAKGISPMQAQDEVLIFNYKEKTKNYTQDEKRSGIITVDENEVILTHIKARNGKEGRDLNLHFLKVLDPVQNKFNISHTNAIEAKEKEDRIEYIAQKKGFVIEDENKYDIQNTLDFRELDFKKIGTIKAGLDKGVVINVKFPSDIHDAINSGIKIECQELNVEGNIAANTYLNAIKINIKGITHSKSKINAEEVYVKTHRGHIDAKEVNIDLLEGGKVKAEIVKIKKSLGGIIEADKIYIEEVLTNNVFTFYQNIVLEKCQGDNNKFNAKIKSLDRNYTEELFINKNQILQADQKIDLLKRSINSSQQEVYALKKKVLELKNSNQTVPLQYEKIIKDFDLYNQEFIKWQNQKNKLEYDKNQILQDLDNLQNELLKAKLINKSGKWSNMNEIKFEFLNPRETFFYAIEEQEETRSIGIIKNSIDDKETIIEIDRKLDYDEKDIQWLLASKG